MAIYKQDEYHLAREVNILDFLKHEGYILEKSGTSDYQLKEHDSLKISADGKQWNWFSEDAGGKSTIELVHRLEGISKPEAIARLANYAKGFTSSSLGNDLTRSNKVNVEKPKERDFTLPERNDTHKRAFAYLQTTRGIDKEIIAYCLHENLIYESKDTHNAVFVGQKNEQGEVKHASLRGTGTYAKKPFKGDVTGSDKAYSFALAGVGKTLVVCESAIDALSHASIAKLTGLDWHTDHRLALGGMSDASLELYLKRHPEIRNITFCLDNDTLGKDRDGNPMNHGQVRASALLEKYKAVGYEVMNAKPVNKDLNEELLEKRKFGFESVKTNESLQPIQREKDDILSKLQDGVKSVFTSEEYLEYLKVLSKFHTYSVNNTIMIKMQNPKATMVAGYNAWQKNFGRQVVKAAKAIQIIAPIPENKVKDPNTGEEKKVSQRTRFKVVSVFDISQTEGKELPQLTKELTGTTEGAKILTEGVIAVIKKNTSFSFDSIEGRKGYYDPSKNKIVVKNEMSDIHTVKTLIHELAHSRMHANLNIKKDRELAEVQAESVAFVVADYFGVDTGSYSFPYVATWSSNKEVKELKDSLNLIKTQASSLIKEIEKECNILKEKVAKKVESKKESKVENEKENKVENSKTINLSKDKALECVEKSIKVFLIDEQEVVKDATSLEDVENHKGKIGIRISDIDNHKDAIPEVYDQYVMNLFKKGFALNPAQTLELFNVSIAEKTLSQLVVLEGEPAINDAMEESKSLKEFMEKTNSRLKEFNKGSAKVKVLILDSEIEDKGKLLTLRAANTIFEKHEKQVQAEKDEGGTGQCLKTNFRVYVKDKKQWTSHNFHCEIGNAYQKNLMDFLSKELSEELNSICKKELLKQENLRKNSNIGGKGI